MAFLTETFAGRSGFADRLGHTAETLRRRFSDWRMMRRTLAELEGLSDRELTDLGLSRADLHRVARESVYGN